tara:strand:- start:2286 stop:2507 length:222 start_codon:yes stop_codon:yes gene_type:complete
VRIKFYLLALVSVVASLAGMYHHGRKAGERAIEVDHQHKVDQSNKVAKSVEENIDRKSDSDVRAGLRRWTRGE